MAHPASLKVWGLVGLLSGPALASDMWKQYTVTSLVMAEDLAATGKTLSFPLACQKLPGNQKAPVELKSCELRKGPAGFQVTSVSKTGEKHTLTSEGIRKKNSGIDVDLVRQTYQFVQDVYLQNYVRQTQFNLELQLSSGRKLRDVLGPCNKITNNQKMPSEVATCQIKASGTTYTISARGVRGNTATLTGPKGKVVLKSLQ